jgi:hypothetical protein
VSFPELLATDDHISARSGQLLRNTAGEPEVEKRSRRANAIEALGICALTFLVLWPFCYACGVLGENASIRHLAEQIILVAIGYALVISPFWHGDTAESLGLGNPRRLWRILCGASLPRRIALCAVMAATFAGLIALAFARWPDVVRMFHLPRRAVHWEHQGLGGWLHMASFAVPLSLVITTCAIRYDNFIPAFCTALTISAALLLYAGTAALLHRGWQPFAALSPADLALGILAYVFWGFFQQLFFTSYLGTRMRKGFAPGKNRDGYASRALQIRSAITCGAIAAATLAPAMWLAMRAVSGADAAPIGLLAWASVFAFVPGAAWGWFYAIDPKRLLVATLTGVFFGLIHIDSYGLVLVTAGLGTILAWVFMEDRNRNLVALGFIHGFLGSTFGKLFKSRDAGALRVDYRVGPWNVEEPSAGVLIIPSIVLIAFLVLLIIVVTRGNGTRAGTQST